MNERLKVWEIWHESRKTGRLLTESKLLRYVPMCKILKDAFDWKIWILVLQTWIFRFQRDTKSNHTTRRVFFISNLFYSFCLSQTKRINPFSVGSVQLGE